MNKFNRFLSKRSIEIPPFLVMDVLERALDISASGDDVIHLEVGEPDFDTPANITEAGIMALRAGKTHYTSSTGIPELKTAISKNFDVNYGVEVDQQRIIVTSGSSPAILLALASLLDHGDEIILS
ncbi:MAG: aminotransferase class I/II-fold pyridoxal phosphate-dependent enzyme, partial [Desulfomonilaceae bacterium]